MGGMKRALVVFVLATAGFIILKRRIAGIIPRVPARGEESTRSARKRRNGSWGLLVFWATRIGQSCGDAVRGCLFFFGLLDARRVELKESLGCYDSVNLYFRNCKKIFKSSS